MKCIKPAKEATTKSKEQKRLAVRVSIFQTMESSSIAQHGSISPQRQCTADTMKSLTISRKSDIMKAVVFWNSYRLQKMTIVRVAAAMAGTEYCGQPFI